MAVVKHFLLSLSLSHSGRNGIPARAAANRVCKLPASLVRLRGCESV